MHHKPGTMRDFWRVTNGFILLSTPPPAAHQAREQDDCRPQQQEMNGHPGHIDHQYADHPCEQEQHE